jgi:hypothetical protein
MLSILFHSYSKPRYIVLVSFYVFEYYDLRGSIVYPPVVSGDAAADVRPKVSVSSRTPPTYHRRLSLNAAVKPEQPVPSPPVKR